MQSPYGQIQSHPTTIIIPSSSNLLQQIKAAEAKFEAARAAQQQKPQGGNQ